MSGTSLDIPTVVMLGIEAIAIEYGWHTPRHAFSYLLDSLDC